MGYFPKKGCLSAVRYLLLRSTPNLHEGWFARFGVSTTTRDDPPRGGTHPCPFCSYRPASNFHAFPLFQGGIVVLTFFLTFGLKIGITDRIIDKKWNKCTNYNGLCDVPGSAVFSQSFGTQRSQVQILSRRHFENPWEIKGFSFFTIRIRPLFSTFFLTWFKENSMNCALIAMKTQNKDYQAKFIYSKLHTKRAAGSPNCSARQTHPLPKWICTDIYQMSSVLPSYNERKFLSTHPSFSTWHIDEVDL